MGKKVIKESQFDYLERRRKGVKKYGMWTTTAGNVPQLQLPPRPHGVVPPQVQMLQVDLNAAQ
jgi:hypothetical protein